MNRLTEERRTMSMCLSVEECQKHNRLWEYEQTGLDPEQIAAMQAELAAYRQAEAEGLHDIPALTVNRDGTTRPTAVAVDFDGCLVSNAWPEIGDPNDDLFDMLIRFRQKGGELILWTCREGESLADAVLFCAKEGLGFDALNANLPSWKALFGNDTRKLGADYYIDDKAICVKAARAALEKGE